MENYFVGVDVGTGSARAALVSSNGKILKTFVRSIQTWNPKPGFYEQSSDEIWSACIHCIKTVTEGIKAEFIKGIGFDATCSLVCIDKDGNPLTVSPTGRNDQNVILWLDHRAHQETEQINKLNHSVLKYVGGKISLEMETPKLLWLKNNLPNTWNQANKFFDLPDFLTWKATACDSRSLCSLICKWTYEVTEDGTQGWNKNYFEQIGMSDLAENNWQKIGYKILQPGAPVGNGLSFEVANELKLLPETPVGTSMIDAHAGGLGLFGCSVGNQDIDFSSRIGLICGTSTCHMAVSKHPKFVKGIWGPYYSAMVPEMWLNEGGQSATGKLIDHIIESHPVSKHIQNNIGKRHIQDYLSELLSSLAVKKNLASPAYLTKDLHVWPDFHGNRSPISNPNLKGMISGLTLSQDEESLAILYMATIQALAYGTRHILETLRESGYSDIKEILICGGLSKNKLFIQTQADVANLPVICPEETESVLLGASILGACAANYFPNMETAINVMGGKGDIVYPNKNDLDYHEKKYRVFLKMYEDQLCYNDIMN